MAAFLALTALVAAGAGGVRAATPVPASIHAREQAAWRGRAAPSVPSRPAPGDDETSGDAGLDRLVHGYYPYWMDDAYLTFPWTLLTAVAWFSLELDGSGAIVDAHGWPWDALVEEAHRHGTSVLVTATLFDGDELDTLLASSANRRAAVRNVVAQVVAGGADGVSVDFENVPHARKADLVAFLGEMQTALAAAVVEPGLTITTPAVDWSDAYDLDALAARCDHLVVMAYDYHGPWSDVAGPVAPLAGEGWRSIARTVGDHVAAGAPPRQILLGVPYYGYQWATVSGDAGASTVGVGSTRRYEAAAGEAELHGSSWDGPSSTPWLAFGDPDWRQTWYDDAASLGAKYAFVESAGLAGVSIWALGYDGDRPELWRALETAFADDGSGPEPALARAALTPLGASPFPDVAHVRWTLPQAASARISVYDARGRLVRSLHDGFAEATGEVRWDGRGAGGGRVPTGIYFMHLESERGTALLRLVMMR